MVPKCSKGLYLCYPLYELLCQATSRFCIRPTPFAHQHRAVKKCWAQVRFQLFFGFDPSLFYEDLIWDRS